MIATRVGAARSKLLSARKGGAMKVGNTKRTDIVATMTLGLRKLAAKSAPTKAAKSAPTK